MNKAALCILMTATLALTQGCGNRLWEDTKTTTVETFDYVFDTTPTARPYHDLAAVPIIELNYRAADTLYSNISSEELTANSAVFVHSFANQGDPSDKSVFGRIMAEQVSDRLVQHGVLVTEGDPNVTDLVYASGVDAETYRKAVGLAGTFKELPPRAAKLVGSYMVADNTIYMSAQIIRLVDSAVVSAYNWTLPVTDNVRMMLPQLKVDEGLVPTVRTSFKK